MSELFLSRLRLDPQRYEVQRALAGSQAMHALLLSAFPAAASATPRQALGVLFRVEIDARSGVPVLLVQSAARPDWSILAALLPDGARPEVKETSRAYAAVAPGQTLRFRLRANPTRRVHADRQDDTLAGKRVNLRSEEEQRKWLASKLRDQAGCELLSCAIRDEPTQRGMRDGKRLSHGAVVFDGVLRVDDPDALRAAVRAGIGAGKAYGFGLLSVAPVRFQE